MAREYNVPRASISQSIKRLEDELGTVLFDRAANVVKLNDQGKTVYLGAKSALTMLSDMRKKKNDVEVEGQIKLLVISSKAIVLEAIRKYREKYANVYFS